MAQQAGNLHWNRVRLTLDPGTTDIDTEITLQNLGYQTLEPPIGRIQVAPPANGEGPASRVMIIPLPPMASWLGIVHGEPWLNSNDGRVHVEMTNVNEVSVELNCLFWNPHTVFSPGQADPYRVPCLENLIVSLTFNPAVPEFPVISVQQVGNVLTIVVVPTVLTTGDEVLDALRAAGFTVVGNAPDQLALPDPPDVWVWGGTFECVNELVSWNFMDLTPQNGVTPPNPETASDPDTPIDADVSSSCCTTP